MALTWRAAALAALGIVPVALVPSGTSVLAVLAVFVLLVAADVLAAPAARRLQVTRDPTVHLRLGTSTQLATTVTNTGRRRLRGHLTDGWQPSAGAEHVTHRLDVAAGASQRFVTALTPDRRGDRLALHVTVRSLGPLRVAARQRSLAAPGSVRVLPPFTSRKHLPSKLVRLREIEGQTALRVRGQGTEFDSLREYVIGDDVRSIDWRATARGGQVVVRTWRPERDRRVMLVLDTSRTSAARIGDAPRLDAAMDAALLLAALASRAGDRVDLIAADQEIRARVERTDSSTLMPTLVTAMAPLEATLLETDWASVASVVRQAARQRCLVVLLTTLDTASLEEGLLPVLASLTSHHQVVLASVADPAVAAMTLGRSDAFAVHAAAAAERSAADRAALTAELARAGVEVVHEPPDRLPPALADRYLALKAAGRL